MLTPLAVPFVDTSAAALSWWLGDDAPPALATLHVPGRAGELELRLLGASHQVIASAGGARCPEVVACGPRSAPLPRVAAAAVGDATYRFRSSTSAYDSRGVARVARDLRARFTGRPDALVGVFPGSPDALTVLTGRETRTGWAWSSWHVYPNVREVVRTRSRLSVLR